MLNKLKQVVRSRRSPIRGSKVIVGSGFAYGDRCAVWAPNSLVFGANVALGSDVRIEVDGVIGDKVLIANRVGIVGKTDHRVDQPGIPISDGDWVGAGGGVQSQPIRICSDVWIGYGATVLSGVSIGIGSIVGAGSVVTRSILPNQIVAGNPAKVIGYRFSEKDFVRHLKILDSSGIDISI